MSAINLFDLGKSHHKEESIKENIEIPKNKKKLKWNFDKVFPIVNEKDMGMTFKGKAFEGLF